MLTRTDRRTDLKWYEIKDGERKWPSFWSTIEALKTQSDWRMKNDLIHARLYGNAYMLSLSLGGYNQMRSRARSQIMTLNVCGNMVDTIVSKVTSQTPTVRTLTDGGSFQMQRKAMRLQRYIKGLFYLNSMEQVSAQVFRDAAVFGTGCIKLFEREGKPAIERVIPSELLVDEVEALYGPSSARQLYQRKFIDRMVLVGMFPKFRDEIMHAPRPDDAAISSPAFQTSDPVECYEGWHKASGSKAKDGRHIICIDGADLVDEAWGHDSFPFIFLDWVSGLRGFWGVGLVESLKGIQLEINWICRTLSECYRLATPKILLEAGSQVSTAHLSDAIWSVLEYSGSAPIFHAPQATSPELPDMLDRLYSRAQELAGISTIETRGYNPGLESGAAVREYGEQASVKYAQIQGQYEHFWVETAKAMVAMTADLAKSGTNVELMAPDEADLRRIKWADIDLDRDAYVLKLFPANALPDTPAGKIQTAVELVQAGIFNQTQALMTLDMPDLKAINDLMTSSYRDIMSAIDSILEDGVNGYSAPEPFQDLELTVRLVTSALQNAKTQQAPEDRIDLLRQYIEEAVALQEEAQMGMMEQQQMGVPQPGTPAELLPPQAQGSMPAGPAGPAAPPPQPMM